MASSAHLPFCIAAGAWAAVLTTEAIPERVRERAALQTRSIDAAARAGAAAAAPVALVAPDGPAGEVYARAAASMAHDWDDYLYMGHPGHSTVPAAHAVAPDPDRALAAQVAGDEVAARLGAALALGPHNGQFWSSIHCAGSAIAAGVGLGLDGDRLGHALAISLYQPPYGLWPGFMGPATKLLTAAEPAAAGVRAALLAAEGLDGPLGIVEDRRGVLAHLAFAGRPAMLGALGRVWLTDTLAFKPFPGCAYLQAAVDAALRSGVAARDVARIDVAAGQLTVGMEHLGLGAGTTAIGVTFSVARSVAVALLAGRLTHRELEPSWLAERGADVEALAARVRIRHDWDATLATLRGAAAGGASLRDVGARGLLRTARRARALGMDEANPGREALAELVRNPGLMRELGRIARGGAGPTGIEALDTAALRMTFPCRLELRLRSGRTISVEGREPGACGDAVTRQDAVVAAREAAIAAP